LTTDARGVTAAFSYDALNRLVGIDYADDSRDVTFEYDQGLFGVGRLTGIVDESGSTDFAYDAFGNLLSQTKIVILSPGEEVAYTTSYTWDAADRVLTLTYPNGRIVTYERDTLGRVSTVSTTFDGVTVDVVHHVRYLPNGPVRSLMYGNLLATQRRFDTDYRLIAETVGPMRHVSYVYDAASSVSSITDHVFPARSQSFEYDALDRLVSESGIYGDITYQYDRVGNRLEREITEGATTKLETLLYQSSPVSSNRLVQIDKGNFNLFNLHYDAAGNVTLSELARKFYVYSDTGRLAETQDGWGELVASYYYNALGQRMLTKQAASDKGFLLHYDMAGRIIGMTNMNTISTSPRRVLDRDYIWLDDMPVAMMLTRYKPDGTTPQSIERTYLHPDHLNTPRVGTDDTGVVVWEWVDDAFGSGAPDLNPDGDGTLVRIRLRFPGQILDPDSGYYYNYFRDYERNLGRYVQSDPIGITAGLNTYTFVINNPLAYTDSLGLEMECHWVTTEVFHETIRELVQREEGRFETVCVPTPAPTGGFPPISLRRAPSFPSPFDIRFEIRCIERWIITQDAKWRTRSETWMRGFMKCIDRCTGEERNHWAPPRRLGDVPRI